MVTGYSRQGIGPSSGLRIGGVILALEGAPADSLVAAWTPLYATSKHPTERPSP